MACTHIESELQSARLALKEAKKEDKFKLQYMLIVPAVISIYRMNEAQEAARKRIDELELLYQRQACNSQNTGIPWSYDFINRYKEKWNWPFLLNNPS